MDEYFSGAAIGFSPGLAVEVTHAVTLLIDWNANSDPQAAAIQLTVLDAATPRPRAFTGNMYP